MSDRRPSAWAQPLPSHIWKESAPPTSSRRVSTQPANAFSHLPVRTKKPSSQTTTPSTKTSVSSSSPKYLSATLSTLPELMSPSKVQPHTPTPSTSTSKQYMIKPSQMQSQSQATARLKQSITDLPTAHPALMKTGSQRTVPTESKVQSTTQFPTATTAPSTRSVQAPVLSRQLPVYPLAENTKIQETDESNDPLLIPVKLVAEDTLTLPRGTPLVKVEAAAKENYDPKTAMIHVSPARSVNSMTHVDIFTTIPDIKTDFDIKLEDMERRLMERVDERMMKNQERVMKNMECFITVGVYILLRNLEDMTLEKMRCYTHIPSDAKYERQVDRFRKTFSSCLTDEIMDHLRHSQNRENANIMAHRDAFAPKSKELMQALAKHLDKYGSAFQQELVRCLIQFLWGQDDIRRRR